MVIILCCLKTLDFKRKHKYLKFNYLKDPYQSKMFFEFLSLIKFFNYIWNNIVENEHKNINILN